MCLSQPDICQQGQLLQNESNRTATYSEQLRIWEWKSKEPSTKTIKKPSNSCCYRTHTICGRSLQNHSWSKAPAAPAALLKGVLSLAVWSIQSFLRSLSTLGGNNIDGTTIPLTSPETARTHWYSRPNKAGFLSFRTTVAAFACAADVVWWRRPNVNLKLIGFCQRLNSAALAYLKESSHSNKLYSVHPSSVLTLFS